jgi:hypothetical protein
MASEGRKRVRNVSYDTGHVFIISRHLQTAAFPTCLPMPLMIEPEPQIACKQHMKLEQANSAISFASLIEITSVPWAILIS